MIGIFAILLLKLLTIETINIIMFYVRMKYECKCDY
jgi:hypothetical protein